MYPSTYVLHSIVKKKFSAARNFGEKCSNIFNGFCSFVCVFGGGGGSEAIPKIFIFLTYNSMLIGPKNASINFYYGIGILIPNKI